MIPLNAGLFEQTCAGDEELKREVEALLSFDENLSPKYATASSSSTNAHVAPLEGVSAESIRIKPLICGLVPAIYQSLRASKMATSLNPTISKRGEEYPHETGERPIRSFSRGTRGL